MAMSEEEIASEIKEVRQLCVFNANFAKQ